MSREDRRHWRQHHQQALEVRLASLRQVEYVYDWHRRGGWYGRFYYRGLVQTPHAVRLAVACQRVGRPPGKSVVRALVLLALGALLSAVGGVLFAGWVVVSWWLFASPPVEYHPSPQPLPSTMLGCGVMIGPSPLHWGAGEVVTGLDAQGNAIGCQSMATPSPLPSRGHAPTDPAFPTLAPPPGFTFYDCPYGLVMRPTHEAFSCADTP